MIYIIISFLSFLITIVLTPNLINFLNERDLVDNPNGEERRMHTEPIPTMGGIIIFAVIFAITFAFYHDLASKIYFVTGAFIVFGLGLLDDLKSVKWQIKFIVQSIAALLLIISFSSSNFTTIQFLGYTLLPGFNYIVLFILILGLLNAFNLMDGLDGLVSGYSLIIATMCFLLNMSSPLTFFNYLSAAVIGSTLGFLKFNANPARIFLGDSGSLILGYLITGLVIAISSLTALNSSIQSENHSNTIDLTFIIIALAVPIADTLRVIIVRLRKGKHIFLADTNHLHHLLYSKNIEHRTAVMIVHLFSIMFVLLAIYYARISKPAALIIFAVMLLSLFAIKQILNFIISKEHLLNYARVYKRVPDILPRVYKKFLLPMVSILLIVMFIILIISDVKDGQPYYKYFLLFILPALLYSSRTLRKNNYYAELLVLVNLILFFIITGFNGFFYKIYALPVFVDLNLNQMLLIMLSGMVIFFVLFKERVANVSMRFLTGTDLTIAVLIIFIYIAVQFINLPEPYKISDTLIRSFLIFLFYKIIIVTVPRFHFSLYYISFAIAIIALAKSSM